MEYRNVFSVVPNPKVKQVVAMGSLPSTAIPRLRFFLKNREMGINSGPVANANINGNDSVRSQ
ncbi:MAG: hypothetical protein ACYTEL_22390 [Planctomycetota bacterium]|jgi:hypothetical protein